MSIYRYSCGERAFILIDGRNIDSRRFRNQSTARMLCAVNEAEAVLVLENEGGMDFKVEGCSAGATGGAGMSDGGTLAGGDNLAVAVAFADLLGLKPRGGAFTYGTADPSKTFTFRTPDGIHTAEVLTHFGESKMVSIDGAPGLETICEGEL